MQTSHSPAPDNQCSTSAKLLQAAAEFVGGEEQLALRLDIAPLLLRKLMAGLHDVPDPLLFRAVDIVLAHPQSLIPLAAIQPSRVGADSL
jgi:hypothetical protein